MQDSVAAIRASRSHARFVLPPAHRRERRLGLHRFHQTPGGEASSANTLARRHPYDAIREAARGLIENPVRSDRSSYVVLRREPRMRWSRDDRSRVRSAAPWRG